MEFSNQTNVTLSHAVYGCDSCPTQVLSSIYTSLYPAVTTYKGPIQLAIHKCPIQLL